MANTWFRMYHEFATDPKVQMLSEVDQRRFVMVLCLRCCNGDETLHDEEVAFQLRISNDEWKKTKAVFIAKGILNKDNLPTNWDKRQYISDSSTERVRSHREKMKRSSNVPVTPPDTDTDTDTDTDKEKDIGEKPPDDSLKKKTTRFVPPSEKDVIAYCRERNKGVDPVKWINFYQAKDWMIGKNKMKDWKAAIRTWEKGGNSEWK
jgi:hypothetical protein